MKNARLTFIGGLDTIGKNLMVIEHQRTAVIVDCGMTFPDDDMYGINIVIPNFDYIRSIRHKIKAVIITHGHEDHIGALGYLYREINVPLYATKLTLEFALSKFSGSQKKKLETKIIVPGQKYVFDTITIEPYSVCHSIPDGVGLIIEAGETRIVHSGDFKLDNKPIDGKITDLPRLKRLKDVDLLLCDSTNADQQGHTCSESMVANTFKKIFSKTTGRIVIASFSSNVLRLQSVLTVAQEHNRRVCILGRNMQTAFTLAKQAGVIKCPPQTIFDIKQVSSLTDNKVVILTTGSQGEKMSALTQMSKGTFEAMRLKKEDTVIISAMPIPGNEPDINETVDRLHRIGVTLYYDQIDEIHASGHACADELKQLIKTVNPKYFIPIHGEYKHLLFNTELAHSVGVRKNNALIVRNGDQVDCDHDSCRVVNHVNGAPVLIDGNYFANPNEPMFDERYYLSRSGMLVVSILADDKQVLNDPVFNGYGCLYRAEIDTVLPDLKKMIIEQYKKTKGSNREREQFLRRELERVIYETVRRRPKVFVNILAA